MRQADPCISLKTGMDYISNSGNWDNYVLDLVGRHKITFTFIFQSIQQLLTSAPPLAYSLNLVLKIVNGPIAV